MISFMQSNANSSVISSDMLSILRNNPKDLILLSNFFYRVGEPIISDIEWNALTDKHPDVNRHWDDEIDVSVIVEKYGINLPEYSGRTVDDNYIFNRYMDSLEGAGTKSISPAYTYDDVYSRMMSLAYHTDEIVASLKVDGISTRNIIEQDNNGEWRLVASLSRSRESRGFDYTNGMKLVVPNALKFDKNAGLVHEESGKRVIFSFGEAYVKRSVLKELRERYGKQNTWKTPRSTALSMLRDIISKEDYKHLIYRCFKLDIGGKLSDMLRIASDSGLDIVPFEVIKTDDIPKDRKEWDTWFNNLLSKYHSIQEKEDIEADGIVIAVNDQSDFNSFGESTDGRYNNATFSCKVGPWGSHYYESVVKKLHFENEGNTSEFSVVAEVEPVVVATGNTVSRVNCFNLKILIDNNINIGSIIKFEYKSASSIVLVYS